MLLEKVDRFLGSLEVPKCLKEEVRLAVCFAKGILPLDTIYVIVYFILHTGLEWNLHLRVFIGHVKVRACISYAQTLQRGRKQYSTH